MASTANKKAAAAVAAAAPCGACKFLRRKCVSGCVFWGHFGSEQGAPARFAAVHKVFGASNVSKLLKVVPKGRRHDAVLTVCYEAQARLCDPVLGCVATILALHHQVLQLQTELSIIQSQLLNSKLAAATTAAAAAFQYSSTQQQMMTVQPACSNSSVSNNLNLSNFSSSGLHFSDSQSLELLQLSLRNQDDEEEVEDSTDQNPEAFSDQIFQP